MSLPTPTSHDNLLSYAVHLAALGFAVFPLHTPMSPPPESRCSCGDPKCEKNVGKHPRTANGFLAASVDAARVTSWWTTAPAANIGLATGSRSGVWVLDVDGADGAASLASLTAKHGPLPETLWAKTGNGYHAFFRLPTVGAVPRSTSRIALGLDVRGDGGYIVAPPSLHRAWTRYAWMGVPSRESITDAPQWLLDLVRRPSAAPVVAGTAATYSAGRRNDLLVSHGGKMRRDGADEETILRGLRALNATTCSPPLDESEVRKVAASLMRYPAGAAPAPGVRSSTAAPIITSFDTIEPEQVEWLWRDRLPRGAITILDGDPGLGKSTLAIDIAARITRGLPMPGSVALVPPSDVLFLTAEDSLPTTVVPRFLAASGDLARVSFFELPDGDAPRLPVLPDDLAAFRAAIDEKRAVLVIVDPFVAFINSTVNAHRDQDVRRVLGALAKMAQETGVAFLLIRHLNKDPTKPAQYRGGGSIGIIGAARMGWLVARDPADADRRVFACMKNNLGAPWPSHRFHLEGDVATHSSKTVWDDECDLRPEDLLAAPKRKDDTSKAKEAEETLREILRDGWVLTSEVDAQASAARVTKATLGRAKRALGVVARKVGMKGGWAWCLPEMSHRPLQLPLLPADSAPVEGNHDRADPADGDRLRGSPTDSGRDACPREEGDHDVLRSRPREGDHAQGDRLPPRAAVGDDATDLDRGLPPLPAHPAGSGTRSRS